jgi:hypothetical protein
VFPRTPPERLVQFRRDVAVSVGLVTLRVTPAMAAGVSKTLWSMDDVVRFVEEWEDSRETGPSE